MHINDLIAKMNTTPFLFLGSGVTRRYYGLPDWKGLLQHFAEEVKRDDLAYSAYVNKAEKECCVAGVLPKVAELIQADYDEKWFSDSSIRHVDKEMLDKITRAEVSPFKAEVAQYIKDNSVVNASYTEEINLLKELAERNISGVITTNYDNFIEETFKGYTKYVGQKQLIFSAIQGVAEIYKIHGSVESPETLVINEKDYADFEKDAAYLAAKLMTIFMEYPIIFLGYSISDSNIINILSAIARCLDDKQMDSLKDRFIFVEYQKGVTGVGITPHTIMIDGKSITMTKVVLEDYKLLFNALRGKKSKLPARVLRLFKQELYDFTVDSNPATNLIVADLDDIRVKDDDLVLSIGRRKDSFGVRGLKGLTADEWYRNIVMDDLQATADDLLANSFLNLYKQNSSTLPLNKYLREATQNYPECIEAARKQQFDSIISNTIKKNRRKLGGYDSVKSIWDKEKEDWVKATDLIAHLEEGHIDVDELEEVLKEIFTKDNNVLQNAEKPAVRTNVRRLIRIYDYLKWGK